MNIFWGSGFGFSFLAASWVEATPKPYSGGGGGGGRFTVPLRGYLTHDGSLRAYQRHFLRMQRVPNVARRSSNDFFSYATIKIGTPGQPFNVALDTWSSELWVASRKGCGRCPEFCKTHNTYDGEESRTYKSTNESWDTYFIDYSVGGSVAIDYIEIAGVRVTGMKFGEALYHTNFKVRPLDGALGLGLAPFPLSPVINEDNFFVKMVKQGLVKDPVFSLYFNKKDYTGQMMLGGVDPARYSGEFTFINVSPDWKTRMPYWKIKIDGVAVGNKVFDNSSFYATPDTSSSVIQISANNFKRIIPELHGLTLPIGGITLLKCSNISVLPDITFIIKGKNFSLSPSDYMFKFPRKIALYGKYNCMALFAIQPEAKEGYACSLGLPFLRKFYTQFDMVHHRVGFATAKHD